MKHGGTELFVDLRSTSSLTVRFLLCQNSVFIVIWVFHRRCWISQWDVLLHNLRLVLISSISEIWCCKVVVFHKWQLCHHLMYVKTYTLLLNRRIHRRIVFQNPCLYFACHLLFGCCSAFHMSCCKLFKVMVLLTSLNSWQWWREKWKTPIVRRRSERPSEFLIRTVTVLSVRQSWGMSWLTWEKSWLMRRLMRWYGKLTLMETVKWIMKVGYCGSHGHAPPIHIVTRVIWVCKTFSRVFFGAPVPFYWSL